MDKNQAMEKLNKAGLIPVAVIEVAEKAVPLAKAMLAGDVDVIEVTFRTAAAPEAIRLISQNCKDMLVGAGTVLTLEQCKTAVASGAKFIVCPGFDEEIVEWCIENDILIVPGCVTPTEISKALKHGIQIVKFFPANVYGGLSAMKALAGPFSNVKFIPTGGINADNVGEYISAPFIYAVGGSWVCTKADISAGNVDKITELCVEARRKILGFEVAHIGINCANSAESEEICRLLWEAFDFDFKPGNSSNFSSRRVEVMKLPFLGEHGHIAIRTNSIECAIAELEKRGFRINKETKKEKGGKLVAAYLQDEIGGFAIHLVQKN